MITRPSFKAPPRDTPSSSGRVDPPFPAPFSPAETPLVVDGELGKTIAKMHAVADEMAAAASSASSMSKDQVAAAVSAVRTLNTKFDAVAEVLTKKIEDGDARSDAKIDAVDRKVDANAAELHRQEAAAPDGSSPPDARVSATLAAIAAYLPIARMESRYLTLAVGVAVVLANAILNHFAAAGR